jgi:hypothetical protein
MKLTKRVLSCALALGSVLATATPAQKDCLPVHATVALLEEAGGHPSGQQSQGPQDLSHLLGRAVLIKMMHPDRDGLGGLMTLYTHRCETCIHQVDTLNLLHRKFRSEGLTVLGLTEDPEPAARRWVRAQRVEHAWARDPTGVLPAIVAPNGGCGAALIDVAGRVVWRGDPTRLRPEVLLPVLAQAFALPMDEWGAAHHATRSALRRGDLAEALQRARTLPESLGGTRIRHTVQYLLDARVELFEAADRAGDRLSQLARGRDLLQALGDDARRGAIQQRLTDLKGDSLFKEILASQRELVECRGLRLTRKKERVRSKQVIERILRELPNTHVAWEARQLLARIQRIEAECKRYE